ncbi:MAG: exo-alpha-sialidase [Verrucomicrobia bacterium]|nr:exo-alpha-sialidase [Verrucomicrobiota bacterium]
MKTNRCLSGWQSCVCSLVLLVATTLQGVPPKPPRPPVPTDPFVISTDTATYGKRVSQQIPAIARVGTRWFCIWYGVNKGQPGISGEGTGCYNTLAMSDDDCKTWKEFAYFIPDPKLAAQSIIDPRLSATPEGPLLILIPVSGQKGRSRSVWSVLLKNPLSKGEPFAFGPPKYVDFGFVGSAALIGGQVYFTANQNSSGPPPWHESVGMKLYRIASLANDQIQTERVACLPYAAADGSMNSCFEVSLAETGKNRILACFRTTAEQYMTRSTDGGKTWSTPKPFTAHPNCANTKADLARSPSGRLVLAFNRMAKSRESMCIALSSDGGETWPHYYVFDDRKGPGASYPNVQFGADASGKYDGNIYVAYDHGRGKRPPDFTKEITIAVIPEKGVVEGKPTSTRYIVSK